MKFPAFRRLISLAAPLLPLAGVSAELLFHCPFDGSAVADVAKGGGAPLAADRVTFVDGLRGQALHVGGAQRTALAYAFPGNLRAERGTVAFWFRPDPESKDLPERRTMFQADWGGESRAGSGAVMVWRVQGLLRGDVSDADDRYVRPSRSLPSDAWTHLAFTWNERTSRLYVNGRAYAPRRADSYSPLGEAFGKGRQFLNGPFRFPKKVDFARFFVGSAGGSQPMCGALDELSVYDGDLSPSEVLALARDCPGGLPQARRPDYAARNRVHRNASVAQSLARAGVPGPMTLLAEWRATADYAADQDAFRAIGACRLGALAGVPYLEAGAEEHARFALRFRLDPTAPLHCFEIDYPDDAVRTADFVIQACRGPLPDVALAQDYTMQVGVATGDDCPNTGRTLTHRCLCWTYSDDVALIAMTARKGQPAAVSAVRVYRVDGGALPAARMNAPPPAKDGWRRTFALYYEDPTIRGDFARGGTREDDALELIDRLAATMKYTGQDLLCYPAVWYQGEIGEDYMPRPHPPAYREAYYAAFDREGLGFLPTLNPNEIVLPDGLVTPTSVRDGSLHDSPVSILATGLPNPGGWHGTPPNYVVTHPELQRQVFAWFDRLVAEGRDHPSFRGLCLHLTRHSPLWFGGLDGGYNDALVERFARETGRTLPAAIDRTAPLRGKAYADWLTNDCAAAWTDWRCGEVAKFWKALAARLHAARPDLKLVVNLFLAVMPSSSPLFGRPDCLEVATRQAGFDPARFADVPNLVVMQSVMPADYRWMHDWRYGRKPKPSPERLAAMKAYQRTRYLVAPDFANLVDAAWPWVNQHDRYWESPIGAGKRRLGGARSAETLNCPWLTECKWRVSTINPSGVHALRQYAVPLRYGDVLGLSKGGFLIGTYGTEELLVPWIQAFRALPAVVMAEVGRRGDVVARQVDFAGRSYFYLVNTDGSPRTLDVVLPEGSENLVTGARLEGPCRLTVPAYGLMSFAAPKGKPQL